MANFFMTLLLFKWFPECGIKSLGLNKTCKYFIKNLENVKALMMNFKLEPHQTR